MDRQVARHATGGLSKPFGSDNLCRFGCITPACGIAVGRSMLTCSPEMGRGQGADAVCSLRWLLSPTRAHPTRCVGVMPMRPPAGSRSCCRVAGNPWSLLLELARRDQDAFAERSRSTCLRVLPSNHDRPSCSKNPRSAFQNHGVRRLPDVAFGWSATAVPLRAAARESLTTPGAQVQFHP